MPKSCDNNYYPEENEIQYKQEFNHFPQHVLSPFQKHGIECIATGNNVLCTSFTGSGKTVLAEYAMIHGLKQNKKVIYTSPIKALSNQKYHELSKQFPSVGLVTGDVKLNQNASILIMTTEILLNALSISKKNNDVQEHYKHDLSGVNISEDVACVIFDECHYINDASRGHVWEQSIFMLPKHIQLVMLSATIDKPEQFATWVEKVHGNTKEVWICSTDKRPVPQQHQLYMVMHDSFIKSPHCKSMDDMTKQFLQNNTSNLITIKSKTGTYCEESFITAQKYKQHLVKWNHPPVTRKFVMNSLLRDLKGNFEDATTVKLPAIVFLFSRKQVELAAEEVTTNLLEDDSKIPYIVADECEKFLRDKLPNFREYMELPQYTTLIKLLEKGVGIHHAGMISILREIVELFISKRYIKVLFATESFAIGLNCPIKTAIFLSMEKFDGVGKRLLLPHEYNQMAGRAGRRGIDTIGNIIHCVNLFPIPTNQDYKNILCGSPQTLVSKFSIDPSVIFSYIRSIETKTATKDEIILFIKQSMYAFEHEKQIQIQERLVEKLESTITKNTTTTTPEFILKEYTDTVWSSIYTKLSQKKKKEWERKVYNWKVTYPSFTDDVEYYKHSREYGSELQKEKAIVNEMRLEIERNLDNTITMLIKQGFIVNIDDTYSFTKKGSVASYFAENPPRTFATLWTEYNDMKNMSVYDWIAFLSCFTSIADNDDIEKEKEEIEDDDKIVIETKKIMYELDESVHDNNKEIHTHIYEIMKQWATFTNEQECKYCIQQQLQPMNISIGDFTKAILKIANMTREIQNMIVYEYPEEVAILHTLSLIEPAILKYVATSQSLYL